MTKRYALLLPLFFWFLLPAVAQQGYTLYNMRYLPQATFLNPAFQPECKVHVGIPGVSGLYGRAGWSGFFWKDAVELDANDSLEYTIDNAISKLGSANYLDGSARVDALHFGFWLNERSYLSFNASSRFYSRLVLSDQVFQLLWEGNGGSLLGERIPSDHLSLDGTWYNEYAVHYSRQVNDKWTVGGRLKLLQGMANFWTKELDMELFTNEETFWLELDGDMQFNTSGLDSITNGEDDDLDNIDYNLKNLGVGIDLGAVYKVSEKLELSASILDLGFINWSNRVRNYEYNDVNLEFRGFDGFDELLDNTDAFADSLESTLEQLADSLRDQADPEENNDSYRTMLVGRFYFGGNYRLGEKHHLGLLTSATVTTGRIRPSFALSYNYRMRKWLGASVSYSAYNNSFLNIGAGLSFNIFPVQIHLIMDNVVVGPAPQRVKNVQFRTGVNLTFGCKDKDRDKDGVKDKDDECPDTPGKKEFNGCPDKDGDGIIDKLDACPDQKGSKEMKGCPDRDGDGVSDKDDNCPDTPGLTDLNGCPDQDSDGVIDPEDQCPDVPGVVELAGCPDRDSDGVADREDDCPDIAGLLLYKGCPDTDNDSIIDKFDDCPDLAGPRISNGCPDTDGDGLTDNNDSCPREAGPAENRGCPYGDRDGDGIKDQEDACPDVAGPVENQGCPYGDLDGDGVIDKDDRCPQTPGVPENQGCPEIKKEEQEVLNTAFSNLEFQSGKDVILVGSYKSLEDLAVLLQKKPDWKIRLAGHTDSQGAAATNLRLSEKRAKSVAKFLESRGVASDRVIVEWYGETKPISDNTTAAGRQKNRRVEMEVVFE